MYELICTIIIAALSSGNLIAQQVQQVEKDFFSQYPVKPTFSGKPAKPLLTSPDERFFRTRIRYGASLGPVFADHYAVAVWGCGAACLEFAIIDSITGKVYMFPASVSEVREAGERLTYHRDSRAMHIIGSLNEENSADRWYVWDGEKLNLISEKPAQLVDDSQ